MHYRLKSLSLATATLMFSLFAPLLPLTLKFEPLAVQAQTTQNRKIEANRLNRQGLQLLRKSQFQEALEKFQQALVIFRAIGDRKREAQTLVNIGNSYLSLKQDDRALEAFQQALTISKETSDRRSEVSTLGNIGWYYFRLKQYDQALQAFQQALTISKEISDRRSEASALGNIGWYYFRLKQYDQALQAFQQGLAIYTELGDRRREATFLENIRKVQLAQSGVPILDKAEADRLIKQGDQQLKNGQLREASWSFQQVLEIYRKRGDRAEEAAITRRIGSLYRNVEQYTQAVQYFQQALAIFRELSDRKNEALTLNYIGRSYFDLKQYPQALESFQQSLAIYTELGDRRREVTSRQNIRMVQLAQNGTPILSAAEEESLYERLFEQGEQQLKNGQLREASQSFQQLLEIYRKIGDRTEEASTILAIASAYGEVGQHTQALEYFNQALAIYKALGDRDAEAETLSEIGEFFFNLKQYSQSQEYLNQALTIYRELNNRKGVASTLGRIGSFYFNLKQYSQALESFQQALAIYRELGDPGGEGRFLENIRKVQLAQSGVAILNDEAEEDDNERFIEIERAVEQIEEDKLQEALQSLQQALEKYRKLGDRTGEATINRRIGLLYAQELQKPTEALKYFKQAIAIYRELGIREAEAATFKQIGQFYFKSKQHSEGLVYFQQALAIYREIGAREAEALTFKEIGELYFKSKQYSQGLSYFQQALEIYRKLGDRQTEGYTLSKIADFYFKSKQYSQGLEYLQQALVIYRELGDHTSEIHILNDIAKVYDEGLKQYSQALEYYQQAWVVRKESCDRKAEAKTLQTIQRIYTRRSVSEETAISHQTGNRLFVAGLQQLRNNQSLEALQSFQKALDVERKGNNRKQEAFISRLIGWSYSDLAQHTQALEYFQQALAIYREIGDRREELSTLDNIGWSYVALKQYSQALETFQQELTIYQEIGDLSKGENYALRSQQAKTLYTIGSLLEKQNQPELAVIFYKQFINIAETFRQNLQVLPRGQQEACVETSPYNVYRHLADLLLKQDRVLEAQRVLDLLKVQELNDYLRNVRGNNNTAQGLPNLPLEQQTWESYQAILNKAVEIGKELTQLRQLKKQNGTLTPAQEQRIAQLVKAQQVIIGEFNKFTRSSEVLALVTQRTPEALSQDLLLRMGEFNALQDNLRNLQQNAVLLYPLILDDRLELILTTPDSPPIRRTVQVTKKQLNEAIVAFRRALLDPATDAKTPGQQLYNWLIKPLEADLKAANAQTIIYAPDAQLRYIPLAALHDGQQWLVQRYRINNITAASLTDLNIKPQSKLQILAGAFATGRYSFTVGGQSFDFAGLPFAGAEVENLAKTVPTTSKFIDRAFTPEVVPKMDDYSIVHLATHAAFVVGTPDDSFILFGNGDRITLRDMQNWSLKNVDLVVLSACETGLGGKLGNGEEILGLGYQMQRAGARAAIASLWQVSDGGTQVLMNAFYSALNKGMTKVEALRQAQIALITKDLSAVGDSRGENAWIEVVNTRTGLPPQVSNNLSHPYYWAPFILIGNGL